MLLIHHIATASHPLIDSPTNSWYTRSTEPRLQSLPPERTNVIVQAHTPQARPSGPDCWGQPPDIPWRFSFHNNSALLPANAWTAEVYGEVSWPKDRKADAALVERLRIGHSPLLNACDNLLDPYSDPVCLLWKGEPQAGEIPKARRNDTKHIRNSSYHGLQKCAGALKGHNPVGSWRWSINNHDSRLDNLFPSPK